MTAVKSVVILFGSGFDSGQVSALASEQSRIETIVNEASGPVNVSIVSFGLTRAIAGITSQTDLRADSPGPIDRLLTAIGAYALHRKLATVPIGRLLNSLGPVDQGRVFWRAVRRNKSAVELIRSADVLIAADMPAVKTAWMALRRKYVDEAFYDHRSASLGVSYSLPMK